MRAFLRPMAPTATAGILCGDPARALLLAQELMTEPRMSNHHRGLWGYWGETPDGAELTVQATGIGGASAAIVLGELIDSGLERAIRIGTCSSPATTYPLGSAIVAGTVAAAAGAPLTPDRSLTDALVAAGAGPAVALTSNEHPASDAAPHYIHAPATPETDGPFDLQTAALAALAAARGIEFAAALVVAEAGGVPLEDETLEAVALRLGRAAVAALAINPSAAPAT